MEHGGHCCCHAICGLHPAVAGHRSLCLRHRIYAAAQRSMMRMMRMMQNPMDVDHLGPMGHGETWWNHAKSIETMAKSRDFPWFSPRNDHKMGGRSSIFLDQAIDVDIGARPVQMLQEATLGVTRMVGLSEADSALFLDSWGDYNWV